jgi:hypothetical protein
MKVLKDFTCKVTGKRWLVGESYEGSRGEELAAKGFVEAKEKKEATHISKKEVKQPKKKKDGE